MSRETLQEPFFENLWPLILKWNPCAIRFKEYSKFFEPCKTFDIINAHSILSAHGVLNYTLPIAVRCFKKKELDIAPPFTLNGIPCQDSSSSLSTMTNSSTIPKEKIKPKVKHDRLCRESVVTSRSPNKCKRTLLAKRNKGRCCDNIPIKPKYDFYDMSEEEDIEEIDEEKKEEETNEAIVEKVYFEEVIEAPTKAELCYPYRKLIVEPLKEQFDKEHKKLLQRQKLSYDFMTRQTPWYIKEEPWQLKDLSDLTPELESQFVSPSFEYDVLIAIFRNGCRFIIVDIAVEVDINEIKRWTKLCNIIQVIAVTRCDIMARQISLLGDTFHGIHVQENLENTWQEELDFALRKGYSYALKHKILKHCTQNFIFVFSSHRNYCTCDTFRVLHKY